ncbi:arginyltransferase [Thalassotalea maritima]|uniref:arginyltransferase n=1 Tax=Thalassotalea maritima TaxID=3242416 RepID=UPI003528D5A4
MSESKKFFQFGITRPFDCNYLNDKQERLIVVTNVDDINSENYQRLMLNGFRRSGDQVYRPHCVNCRACESLRIPVYLFKPSRSQKRLLNSNKDLDVRIALHPKEEYFELYQRYIDTIHRDGSMYPANKEQYESFIFSHHVEQLFLEVHLHNQLVSVAVCDNLPHALSALYTFYDPQLQKRSLGKFSILQQIVLAQKLNKHYLYLGYQIDACAKMNYKNQYYPHERLVGQTWHRFTEKS